MDENIKLDLINKIKKGLFEIEDFNNFIEFLAVICNESDEIKQELEDENLTIQLAIEHSIFAWIKVDSGNISAGQGEIENSDVTIHMTENVCQKLFSGEIDAVEAYKSGSLKIEGPIALALKFKEIISMVKEFVTENY